MGFRTTHWHRQIGGLPLLANATTTRTFAGSPHTRPAAGTPPGFHREGKPMSEQMIVLIVEVVLGILRLVAVID
jgi:hypothetical protein